MHITVNGQTRDLPIGQTVRDLIAAMGLDGRPVAVEVNRQVIPRSQHETTVLKDGDVVELVTLVGGG